MEYAHTALLGIVVIGVWYIAGYAIKHFQGWKLTYRYRKIERNLDRVGQMQRSIAAKQDAFEAAWDLLEGQVDVLKKAAVGVVFRSQGKMVTEGQYDHPITNEDHTESSKEDGSL